MPVLGLGSGSIDYAAIAERRREREATAPQREAEQQERREAARERIDTMIRQLEAAVRPNPERVEDDVEPEEQEQKPEPNVDQIIRLMPPREPVEESEPESEQQPEPEPEPDRFESLKSELIQALAAGRAAGDDATR
jgi:hypothetical protein